VPSPLTSFQALYDSSYVHLFGHYALLPSSHGMSDTEAVEQFS